MRANFDVSEDITASILKDFAIQTTVSFGMSQSPLVNKERGNTEGLNPELHRCENLKSHKS